MKVEVKKIEPNKRQLDIEVTDNTVKDKFEEVFSEVEKQAKIPGFRPGHAPREMVEKHYSSNVRQKVLEELIPGLYLKAVEKEALDVVEEPQISDIKFDKNSLSFRATVEIKPQIQLPDYKGIRVGYKKIEVTSDEIKRYLDSIKESKKLEKVDDDFARAMCFPNLAELESAVEKHLFIQKESQQRQRIEDLIIGQLIDKLDIKLPQSLLDKQLNDMLRQAKLDLALKGVNRQLIQEQEKALAEKLAPQAKTQVKVYLVLSEIAKKEGITIDEQMSQKVMELLLKNADWQMEA